MFLVQPIVVLVVWWFWLLSWVVVEAASNTERLYVTLGRWSIMDHMSGVGERSDAEHGKNNNNIKNKSNHASSTLRFWQRSVFSQLQQNQLLPQHQLILDRYPTTAISSTISREREMHERQQQQQQSQLKRAHHQQSKAVLVDDDEQSQSLLIQKMRRRNERGGRNPWNSIRNWGSNVARHLGGRGRVSVSQCEMNALACSTSTIECSTIQAISPAASTTTTTTSDGNIITMSLEERLDGLKEPFVSNDLWECLTGNEWQTPITTAAGGDGGKTPAEIALDDLVNMGEAIARHDDKIPKDSSSSKGPSWGFQWKPYKWQKSSYNADEMQDMMEDGHVFVWTGRPTGPDASTARGNAVPVIKTRSIVPLSPAEMADLMMDSSRVKTYNSWSIGRDDCWVSTKSASAASSKSSLRHQQEVQEEGGSMTMTTKIVKNRTKPPMSSKPMVSTTMLHARPVEHEPGTWLVVSRAVGGNAFADENDDPSAGRSDIMLGMNLLQPHPSSGGTILTAVTHVYSSLIPTMLAERLGVQSSINFVKDIRALRKEKKVGA